MTEFEQLFNLDDVPPSWRHCFLDQCPRCAQCLRYQTGQRLADGDTAGLSIFPTVLRLAACPYFKQIRIVKLAYGFKPLFAEVRQKDFTPLHAELMGYIGSKTSYYRYDWGENMLTPEQQQDILSIFARYGYTDGLRFEHYRRHIDYSN